MGVGRQIFESLGVSARRTEPSSTSANTVEEPFVALLEVSKSSAEEALGDVIFIHGLDGDQRGTWTSSDPTRSYWPLMLSEELPRIRVFSLGYKVHSTSWTGNTMPLVDRAINVLSLFEAYGLGQLPSIFICHSLGGLLVKQMLRQTQSAYNPAWKALADNCKGLVFLSTPHSGSNLAGWINYMQVLLPSVSVQELESNAPSLRDLNLWFRGFINAKELPLEIKVFFEKQATMGVLVVDPSSADPGIANVIPIPVDENHSSICKPASRSVIQYMLVSNFIRDQFLKSPHKTTKNLIMTLREDSNRIRDYVKIFDRAAFRMPCVFEGTVSNLDEAFGNISAAFGTGAIYSRNGNLLDKVAPISSFESDAFQNALYQVRDMLPRISNARCRCRTRVD